MTTAVRPRSVATPRLAEIQRPVSGRLEAVSAEMIRIVVSDAPMVGQVSGHLLAMKGKMFRPTLLLLASASAGTPDERAPVMAAAVELIHLATLVHDDAVDHSILRRGLPTVNSMFSHQVSVIMGDFLYSRALVELVEAGDIEALRVLARASNDMSLGELRQLSAQDPLAFSEEDYNLLIRSKTASLMSAACEVGALCGANRYRSALAAYGRGLGMAFQIADDMIDYTEAKETAGKPTGLDLREHKVTLPLIAALRTMDKTSRGEVDAFFASKEVDDDGIARIREIVKGSGGLTYARARGEEFAAAARDSLAALPRNEAVSSLHNAVSYVMERHA